MDVDASGRAQVRGDRAGAAPALATDLTGNLPCIGCGYNLKGLSVRGLCPECGTAVRATILARVDPMAEELRPLRRPRVTAYGLIVWAWAALAAVVCIWVVRLGDAATVFAGTTVRLAGLVDLSFILIALSGLAAGVLVAPVRGMRPVEVIKPLLGVFAYLLLLFVHRLLHVEHDGFSGVPYVGPEGIDPGRSLLRLAENLVIVMTILALRPSAVMLAERSLVMRTGRVDTQPMTALVWSLTVASAGDALLIAFGGGNGTLGALRDVAALVLIAVGSFLFTLGLVGVGVDTLRLRRVLIEPTPGLSDVLGEAGDA